MQIMNARRESKEKNLTWRIQEDSHCWTLLEHFLELNWCIPYVVSKLGKSKIQCFKRCMIWSWNEEVMVVWRQPHQAVRNFAATKWAAKIWQPKAHFAAAKWAAKWNPLAKFCKVFWSCETTSKHTCATTQVKTPSSQLRTTLRNHLQTAIQVANHLQVVKSPPSCEITNSTYKIKVQTCKMDNSTCESPCEIHLCNLRYLQPT